MPTLTYTSMHQLKWIMNMEPVKNLGGFQEAAALLTRLSGRNYTRQGVQQLWKRRDVNGFPDRQSWNINHRTKLLFDLDDIADWYAFPEAAAVLTAVADKQHDSSDVYHLWANRTVTQFPDRTPGGRHGFALDEVAEWQRNIRGRT